MRFSFRDAVVCRNIPVRCRAPAQCRAGDVTTITRVAIIIADHTEARSLVFLNWSAASQWLLWAMLIPVRCRTAAQCRAGATPSACIQIQIGIGFLMVILGTPR
jgi:hypothetical protein